jgi:triacylglycerol lipase
MPTNRPVYPVLLVHGIDDTGRRLNKLRAFLLQKGLQPVTAMDIIPSDASISMSEMAAQVQAAVSSLCRETNVEKIDVVAYSMGALASRYFIQRLGGKNRVRRFISIAGPHHGTYTAYLRRNIGCRQMRPGSTFLREINSDIELWGETAVFSFYTPFDLMIFPAFSSRLPGAVNCAFWVPVHPMMLSDTGVMRAVYRALSA